MTITPQQIDEMQAGPELDRLVAELVMGNDIRTRLTMLFQSKEEDFGWFANFGNYPMNTNGRTAATMPAHLPVDPEHILAYISLY